MFLTFYTLLRFCIWFSSFVLLLSTVRYIEHNKMGHLVNLIIPSLMLPGTIYFLLRSFLQADATGAMMALRDMDEMTCFSRLILMDSYELSSPQMEVDWKYCIYIWVQFKDRSHICCENIGREINRQPDLMAKMGRVKQ